MSDEKRPADTEYRSATRCVLIGLDGSAGSSYALEWAAATGAQLDVLVVAVSEFADLAECLSGPTGPRERDLFARRQRTIADVMARHPDVDISHWRVRGPLAACLCGMAREDDVVVVPASGSASPRSGLAAYCLEHAPCTVSVVPIRQALDRHDWPGVVEGAVAEPAAWLG